MPLFEYECTKCGYQFEELVGRDDSGIKCRQCGAPAKKLMSTFASVISGGSPTEPIDMSVGREADKRWQMHHDRQSKRRGNIPLQDVSQPKSNDGKFMPVMALGEKKQRNQRTEYVGALQEHRRKRKKKGIPQFSGPGEF